VPNDPSPFTTRYGLAAVAACAAALALAAAARGRGRPVALAILAAAAVWSLVESAGLKFPDVPSLLTLLAGAAIGAAAVRVAPLAARAPRAVPLGAAAAGVAAALVLADGATDFAWRHGRTKATEGALVIPWFAAQSEWRDGDTPIFFVDQGVALLAGDRLQHRLEVIPPDEPCDGVLARAREGWVVRHYTPPFPDQAPFTADECLAAVPPAHEVAPYLIYRLR
jgi:hypothetical protein